MIDLPYMLQAALRSYSTDCSLKANCVANEKIYLLEPRVLLLDYQKVIERYTFNRSDTYITYIIGHYNPSVRIIDLVSHTTYVVCVNFIHKWRDLQFKVDSERQIFWETFHSNFIYSQSFCQKSAERGNCRRNTFRISFGLALKPRLFV